MSAQAIETAIETDEARQALSLPASVWRDAFAAVLLSVGKDVTLPVLTTVRVEVTESDVTFTSSDRYRLTRVTVPIPMDEQAQPVAPFTVLLPSELVKRMHGIAKGAKIAGGVEPFMLTHGPAKAGVTFAGRHSGASVSGLAYTDGGYPRVDSIIAMAGTANGVTVKPDRVVVGIDPRSLVDLCKMPRETNGGGKSRKPEPVNLSIGDPNKPTISEWSIGDMEFTYVLMPVRLGS